MKQNLKWKYKFDGKYILLWSLLFHSNFQLPKKQKKQKFTKEFKVAKKS